jgi:hypothetical protein
MEAIASDLNALQSAEEWRTQRASSVFPTPGSWSWFKRKHRDSLVKAGALVLGSGRMCDLVHAGRISNAVQEILTKESLARISQQRTA